MQHKIKFASLVLGPSLALFMWIVGPVEGLSPPAWAVACCMVWIAVWWVFESVPVAATALLPLILFPALGLGTLKETAVSYAHPIIYLFLGGFMIAIAIERWNLHRRLGLLVLLHMRGSAKRLLAGFMMVAAMLSMWISNTATTLMLLPIGLAILSVLRDTVVGVSHHDRRNFEKVLVLSIAYAATIGGIATLVGTPPNAFMAGFISEHHGYDIGFLQWMGVGLPVTLCLLPLAWFVLAYLVYPFHFETTRETHHMLARLYDELGPVSRQEKTVSAVFFLTALAWASRPLLNKVSGLEHLTDPGIAITAGVSLFLLPAGGGEGRRILDWKDTAKLPWGILILFGGGLALAAAVVDTGLALALAGKLADLRQLDLVLLVMMFVTVVIFFTEFTGNLSTVAIFLPIIGALGVQLGVDPNVLLVPATVAASCAFMMPVSTPPNAIIYSSEKVTIMQMARAGFLLNLVAIVLVSLIAVFIVPAVIN